MSRKCPLTGKRPRRGNSYTMRGIAKKKKGIGLKVTGKTKRRFFPNMVTKKLWSVEQNRFLKLTISTSALRLIDKLGLEKVIARSKSKGC
ncbi:50S ribosomal protein L28 [Chlamydia gallinacea]|uniref:Large ribosomal subunit protein bL28 n=2 Tax=Chlamydia gallinacea TaxID=1457153 RepID=A0A173DZX6_9CHLA|nr:50S ribosomal protein L28 [Chlamydia gallinacea]ANG66478.1 50S ribosomal protein L28 [Chlamydia gallinacea 08-1274/3]AQT77333.1 50S ribosomal protein L28 [Chlamydia gallinacea]MBX6680280.1 50S ribosomal protein L28 [Chlamydia gallinacea]MBX6687890.1 50S ribosomal protein L28 [Chlamydia gallinacea]